MSKRKLELAALAFTAFKTADLDTIQVWGDDGLDTVIHGWEVVSNDDHYIYYDAWEKFFFLATQENRLLAQQPRIDCLAEDAEEEDGVDPDLFALAKDRVKAFALPPRADLPHPNNPRIWKEFLTSPSHPDWLRTICTTQAREDLECFGKNTLLFAGMASDDVLATADEWKDLDLETLRHHAIGLAAEA